MLGTYRVGDSSARVAEVRSTLARLGLLDDFTGDVGEWNRRKFSQDEMFFDEELSTTLKAFQQARGILPSGEIDDITLRELRHASYTLGAWHTCPLPRTWLYGRASLLPAQCSASTCSATPWPTGDLTDDTRSY